MKKDVGVRTDSEKVQNEEFHDNGDYGNADDGSDEPEFPNDLEDGERLYDWVMTWMMMMTIFPLMESRPLQR